MIGNFGDVEVFSFHATKFFNTFEGGAIVTNNDELASRIRLMINFGFKNYDTVAYLGINGKMNEVSAAMGLSGLRTLDRFISVNLDNYETYKRYFASLNGITLVTYDEEEKNNYQYIVIEIDEDITGISRDIINNLLHAENILSRRYFYPGCHQMEPYCPSESGLRKQLPETEILTQKVLQLPTGTAVTHEDIEKIYGIIKFIVKNANGIQRKLRE
jgi:dTDP-4-amino-4,6-dideoxygalactose transaminase